MICNDIIFGKETAFEAEFQAVSGERKFRQRAVFMFAAIQAYALMGFLDPMLGGESATALTIVRTLSVLVLSALWAGFVTAKDNARRECFLFGFALASATSVVGLIAVAEGLAADFYPFAFSTMQIVGSCLIVPRFRTMMSTITLSYIGYWVVMAFGNTSFHGMCITAFLLTITTVAVIVGSYARESVERDQFRTLRELARARDDALRMAETAVMANEAKNRMMANVSHELRTPMNAILGFSEVMVSEFFGPVHPPRYRDYIADIHGSGRILLSNIDDLLDMARIESGKMGWEETEFRVDRALDMAAKASRAALKDDSIVIDWTDESDGATMRGDFDRFCQAAINLLNNAAKFSPPGGTVAMTFGGDRGGWWLRVVDEGCGIPEEHMQRIREPFAQVHQDDWDAAKGGLGLGLAITAEIVRRLDGTLEIGSVEGWGTTVTLRLPAERVETAPWEMSA